MFICLVSLGELRLEPILTIPIEALLYTESKGSDYMFGFPYLKRRLSGFDYEPRYKAFSFEMFLVELT